MAILRLFLAAGTTIVLYGVYKLGVQLLAPYFSPLRDLPGPKSKSFIWGNLGEIRKAENSKLHEEWIEKYGKVIKYKGFFNVSCILPSSVNTPAHLSQQTDRLYTTDMRALNHILTHSVDYQKPEMARFNLARLLGDGKHLNPTLSSLNSRCH